jgi:hypothetical protein
MINPPIIFGRWKGDTTPQPTSVAGQTGWWTVPPGYYMKPAILFNPKAAPSEMVMSPDGSFTNPVYYCTLSDDGQTYAFRDQLLDDYTRPIPSGV